MTSESSPSLSSQPAQSSPSEVTPRSTARTKRKGLSQVRLMLMFTLFFTVGVLLLVILPEGSGMVRGIVMTVYSVVVFWAMFRFCM